MGLLTSDRIKNKLGKSILINEHALDPEPVPLSVKILKEEPLARRRCDDLSNTI